MRKDNFSTSSRRERGVEHNRRLVAGADRDADWVHPEDALTTTGTRHRGHRGRHDQPDHVLLEREACEVTGGAAVVGSTDRDGSNTKFLGQFDG